MKPPLSYWYISNGWGFFHGFSFSAAAAKSLQSCPTLCDPEMAAHQAPPSLGPSINEPALRMRWPNYWSFSFRIIPSKEIPGLICFRMDWLDLLAVQGTLKSLLQHHS